MTGENDTFNQVEEIKLKFLNGLKLSSSVCSQGSLRTEKECCGQYSRPLYLHRCQSLRYKQPREEE